MYARIIALLRGRGIEAPAGAFVLQDDGEGAFIARWDEDRLGPEPTEQDLNGVSGSDAATAIPRRMSTRGLIDRFTADEWEQLDAIVVASSAAVKKEFAAWQSDSQTDVNSLRFRMMAAALAPQLWPDPVVRAARMAAILA